MPTYQVTLPPRAAREELVIAYEQLSPILDTSLTELKALAAKRPEMVLTPSQVRMLKSVLKPLRHFFRNEPEGSYLQNLPRHRPKISEAVLLMSQYDAVLEQFARRYRYLNRAALRFEWLVMNANGTQQVCRPAELQFPR